MHICEKKSSFVCRITYCKYGKNMLLYKRKIFVYKFNICIQKYRERKGECVLWTARRIFPLKAKWFW